VQVVLLNLAKKQRTNSPIELMKLINYIRSSIVIKVEYTTCLAETIFGIGSDKINPLSIAVQTAGILLVIGFLKISNHLFQSSFQETRVLMMTKKVGLKLINSECVRLSKLSEVFV
jgi:hypothetical protein